MRHDQKVLVFVYGTLRKGFGNHRLLEHPQVEFVCEDSIRAKMYTAHWGYPFIVFSQSNKDRVVGEVYEVPYSLVINRLDHLEGYQGSKTRHNLYYRKRAFTANKNLVYVYESGDMRMSHCDWVTHGNWVKAIEDREKGLTTAFVHMPSAHPKWTDQ